VVQLAKFNQIHRFEVLKMNKTVLLEVVLKPENKQDKVCLFNSDKPTFPSLLLFKQVLLWCSL